MRILLIEDDANLADGVARALPAENCVVDTATNGADGAHLGATERYDAAVLAVSQRRTVSVARAVAPKPVALDQAQRCEGDEDRGE